MFTQSEFRGHQALRGLLAAALGATLVVWPGITIGTVVVLFAIYALVDAATVTARAFRCGVSGGDRALLLIRAVIEVIAAGVALGYPDVTASILTVILGIYAITIGGLELAVVGRLSQLGAKGMRWDITQGVLGVMTGVALVVWPSIGAVTLAVVFGIYLAIYGVVLLVSAAAAPRRVTAEVRA
jgi:uncharacterized membrane protein HdeD (DUF308 family)